jgi:hypothetical protein
MHEQRNRGCAFGLALLAIHCLATQARAADAVPASAGAAPRVFDVQPGARQVPALPALQTLHAPAANAVGDEQLAQLRGGTDTPWSDMKLSGTVGNNAATNVVTGANIITDGAFTNASGLPMVIQNSGANVLIQNATIVNVQFK